MKVHHLILTFACLALLAACGSSGQEELADWMAGQRKLIKPQVTPISEPVRFTPQAYTQETAIDPFSVQKLAQALKRDASRASANAALIAPELNRRKEPLESSPLDAVSMVGSLIRQGKPVALVKVDNLLYQVQVGNYLGQNFGRITRITETELVLREIVQDTIGEWTERVATLQLREASK